MSRLIQNMRRTVHLDQLKAILAATLPGLIPGWRGDANETLAFARQLEHFYAKVYEIKYPGLAGRELIPINTEVPTGALSHTYRMFDDVGEAAIVDSYANDVPMVDAYGKEYSEKIVPIANGFFISIQDLRSAAMLGIDIDTKKATTAQKIMERKLDKLIALGDTDTSMPGAAKNSNVTVFSTGITGTWASATAAQIVKDLELMSKAVFDQSKGVYGNPDETPLTIAMGTAQYSILAATRLDSFNQTTILEYAVQKIPFIGEIKHWAQLDLANASNNGPRIMVYPKDPDVIETVIPQDFEMLPLQQKGLGYQVPCHMRWGGTLIRYPIGMVYVDGC